MESDWLLGCLLIECAFLTSSTFFSSSQPSLLSAEPLLPPHNFHSHSLRRLPLYQPLHISGPMPASLSVGQPTLPPLPAHHRAPLAGASLSPTQVPPFLSLPRRQPSYGLDQVCVIGVCVFWLRRKWLRHWLIRVQTLNSLRTCLNVHFWPNYCIKMHL